MKAADGSPIGEQPGSCVCFLELFFFERIWVNLEESKLAESCPETMITEQMGEVAATGKERTDLARLQNQRF